MRKVARRTNRGPVALSLGALGLLLAAPGWAGFPSRRPSVEGDRASPFERERQREPELPPVTADASPRLPQQKGVMLGLFAEDVSFSYEALLDEIAALGAKDVALVVPLYQSHGHSQDLHWHTRLSPTLPRLAETIRQARRRRLGVTVVPIVRLERPAPGEWRGNLAPTDRAAWFRRYTDLLGDLAATAAATHADRLAVGADLSTLDGLRDRGAWEALLLRVRGLFDGPLVYAASGEHVREAHLLDWVDEADVSANFPLRREDQPLTNEVLDESWKRIRTELEGWSRERRKPFVLTGITYRSREGATVRPWDESPGGKPAPAEQQAAFAAFRKAWDGDSSLGGFYLGDWYGYGGPGSTSSTPRGKPAEAEWRALLGGF